MKELIDSIKMRYFGINLEEIVELLPPVDKDILYIDMYSDSADINRTEEMAKRIEAILATQKEIESYTTSLRNDLPRFYITASIAVPSPDFAQIILKVNLQATDKYSSNKGFAMALQNRIDSELSGVYAKVNLLESTDPKEGSVLVRVSGNNMQQIQDAAQKIQKEMESIEETINHHNDGPVKRCLGTETTYPEQSREL